MLLTVLLWQKHADVGVVIEGVDEVGQDVGSHGKESEIENDEEGDL